MSRLADRRALVTGGAQGLGRAVARRLAAEGAHVTVVDLNEAKSQECVQLIQDAGGAADYVLANVAKREAIEAAVHHAAPNGQLHVLINAAQYFAMPKALELVTDKDWELSEATGPRATFRFMQTAHTYLSAAGGKASVVNFVSGSAIAGIRFTGPYSAAKGAIGALTRVAANEWASDGIRVNALCPFALTDVQRDMMGTEWDNYARTASESPMKRGADPDTEIAPTVAFLASDDSAFITGTVLHVDGGMTELSTVDYSKSPGVFGG